MKQFTLALLVILALLSSCNSNDKGNGSSTDRPIDSVAINYGQKHAQQLLDAQPDSTAMRRIMLDTRAYETRLRQEGLDYSADDYINAFETHIRSNDPALAIALGIQ